MLMSAAQFRLRLENEYKAMCAFPINSLFSWRLAPGQTPPRPLAYIVTYRVKTLVKQGLLLKPHFETEVLITLPDSPAGVPAVKIVGGGIPYHPNIYPNASFCLGDIWLKEPVLWKLVLNIGHVVAFDPRMTAPDSPANRDAAADWNRKMSGGGKKPYPCGRLDFPHPKGY